MSFEDIRKILRAQIAEFQGTGARGTKGIGLRGWCEENNVASGHASEFLNGKRYPASDLLQALGLEWKIVPKEKP
jgi:hypothetical protein